MSRNIETSSRINDAQEASNDIDISTWSNEKVCEWLKENNLANYIDNFQSCKINGFDLCQISNQDLHSELKIYNLHDRNSITKSIRQHILKQSINYLIVVKINIKYNDKTIEMQLDSDSLNFKLIDLFPYLRDVFKINVISIFM